MARSRNALGQHIAGTPTLNVKGLNQYNHPRIILQRRMALALARELTVERPQCMTTFAKAVADALEAPTKDESDRLLRQVLPSILPRELVPVEPPAADTESATAREDIWADFASRFAPSGPVDAEAVAERTEDDDSPVAGAD